MLISSHNLQNLPVYTKSGQHLGKIASFEIDIDAHSIIKYHVKGNSIIRNIIQHQELIIHKKQVISITKKKMTVEDGTEKEVSSVKLEKIPTQEPLGVMSSKS